jgi:hypothetical protein
MLAVLRGLDHANPEKEQRAWQYNAQPETNTPYTN